MISTITPLVIELFLRDGAERDRVMRRVVTGSSSVGTSGNFLARFDERPLCCFKMSSSPEDRFMTTFVGIDSFVAFFASFLGAASFFDFGFISSGFSPASSLVNAAGFFSGSGSDSLAGLLLAPRTLSATPAGFIFFGFCSSWLSFLSRLAMLPCVHIDDSVSKTSMQSKHRQVQLWGWTTQGDVIPLTNAVRLAAAAAAAVAVAESLPALAIPRGRSRVE
jgi:hypothetical protein